MHTLAIISNKQELCGDKELANLVIILIITYLLTDAILYTDS